MPKWAPGFCANRNLPTHVLGTQRVAEQFLVASEGVQLPLPELLQAVSLKAPIAPPVRLTCRTLPEDSWPEK